MAERRRAKKSGNEADGMNAERVERALWPFVAFAALITILVAAVAAWDSMLDRYQERPILFGTFLFLAACMLAWSAIELYRTKLPAKRLWLIRLAALSIITAAYVFIVVRPNACHFLRNCGPSEHEPFPAIVELLVPPAHAQEPPLVVANVTVDEERSSFRMRRNTTSVRATPEKVRRISFEYDRTMINVFQSASCRGVAGERPIEDALPIWRSILRKRGQNSIARSLNDYAGYRALIRNGGPNGFTRARPTVAELTELKRTNPSAFSIFQRWMVECVGVSDPVLIWTLENRSTRRLILSFVDYHVLDVGGFMGANDVLMAPVDVQPHPIAYAKGRQTRPLNPQISIAAKSTVVIRIAYRMDDREHGRSWLIRPVFRTLQGPTATGPEFKIFAAK